MTTTILKMDWLIKEVDSVELYELAFNWYLDSPMFLKSFSESFIVQDKQEFLASMSSGKNFVGYVNNKPVVLIHGEIKNAQVVEAHLFCSKEADIEFIGTVARYSKIRLLETYKAIVCYVVRKHKILHTVMKMAGLRDTGLRSYNNIYRNNFIEIVFYSTI